MFTMRNRFTMGAKRAAGLLLQLVVVVVLVALVAGQLLGQPILLSYVTTDSMEPTIDPGEGFVALPPELAGGVDEGDVVVYEAEEIEGGGLTTHRVVDETEEGYVTRGDANPFTDQDSGEPHVRDPEVVAVAWQPGGSVFTIPYLGTLVGGTQSVLESLQFRLAQLFGTRALLGLQGLGYLIFGLSVVLYIVAGRFEQPDREKRERSRTRGANPRRVMLLLTFVVVAGMTAAMVLPAGTEEYQIVSAEFESNSSDVIQQGTSESFDYQVVNEGFVSTVVMLEAEDDNIEATPEQVTVSRRSTAEANLTITAPPETGAYRTYLTERRYLGLLPTSVIEQLHGVHPWLPIAAINAFVAVPFYVVGMVLLGRGRIRSRPSRRSSLL
jgi:signal peptidase